MIFIGLDDTDIIDSRGTGQLARIIADDLAEKYTVIGIVRHQLLFDARIPYTAKNSSASILVDEDPLACEGLFADVRALMQAHFIEGSDPGLAIGVIVDKAVMDFGQQAKKEIVTLAQAAMLADRHNIHIAGLGGTNGGMIGALASVGLAASGNDGRYIQVGTIRDLSGLQAIDALHKAGIKHVQTLENERVDSGFVLADNLRPARRNHQPVLFVEKAPDNSWLPLKLD